MSRGVEEGRPGAGRVEWIIGRPLCRFRRFELAGIPRSGRAEALRLELATWSPFASTANAVVWGQDAALVWCWDAERTGAAVREAGLRPRGLRMLPEALLQPPLGSGLRLMECLEGYEGQLWREGALRASRWWPRPPEAGEWLAFRRDCSLRPEEPPVLPPEPMPRELRDEPWAAPGDAGGQPDSALRTERIAVLAGSAALALLSAWYGAQFLKTELAQREVRARLAEVQAQARPVLEARRQALDDLARIRQLLALDAPAGQLALMERVVASLPRDASRLKDWSYANGKLKFTVEGPNRLSVEFVVNALQNSGLFSRVEAVTAGDGKLLTVQTELART